MRVARAKYAGKVHGWTVRIGGFLCCHHASKGAAVYCANALNDAIATEGVRLGYDVIAPPPRGLKIKPVSLAELVNGPDRPFTVTVKKPPTRRTKGGG